MWSHTRLLVRVLVSLFSLSKGGDTRQRLVVSLVVVVYVIEIHKCFKCQTWRIIINAVITGFKMFFSPAAGETPDPRATQTQLPWQRQTSALPVTSLQTQPLTQTVCALILLHCTERLKMFSKLHSSLCETKNHQFSCKLNPLWVYLFSQEEQISEEAKVCLLLVKSNWNEIIFRCNICSSRSLIVFCTQPVTPERPPSQQEPPPPPQPVQRQTPPFQIPR